jgi:cell wall-associated NlpC family hydrolase
MDETFSFHHDREDGIVKGRTHAAVWGGGVRMGWDSRRQRTYDVITAALALLAVVAVLTVPAPSNLFARQQKLAALKSQVPAAKALARQLQHDAIHDANVNRPDGYLVNAKLRLPSWRYLLALTAAQCNGDFAKADRRRVYAVARASIKYTYESIGEGTVRARCTYPPADSLVGQFATPGSTSLRSQITLATRSCQEVYAILGEGESLAEGVSAGDVPVSGVAPLDRETIGAPDSRGIAVNFPPVAYALQFQGVPYVWGGMSPEGMDCSGLVCYVMQHYGVSSGHSSTSQMWDTVGTPVAIDKMKPGDLIFWDRGRIHHCGMYVGGGKYIEAPYRGKRVKLSKLAPRKSKIASVRRPRWQTYTVYSGQ